MTQEKEAACGLAAARPGGAAVARITTLARTTTTLSHSRHARKTCPCNLPNSYLPVLSYTPTVQYNWHHDTQHYARVRCPLLPASSSCRTYRVVDSCLFSTTWASIAASSVPSTSAFAAPALAA